jgi:amidase
MPEQWESISKRKKEEQASRIPKDWLPPRSIAPVSSNVLPIPRLSGLLSERELDITEAYDATYLIKKLAKGQLKSVDVVTAFCKVSNRDPQVLFHTTESNTLSISSEQQSPIN